MAANGSTGSPDQRRGGGLINIKPSREHKQISLGFSLAQREIGTINTQHQPETTMSATRPMTAATMTIVRSHAAVRAASIKARREAAAIEQRVTTLTKIAAEHLGLETLATRNSDNLDFSDQAVWSIRAALEAAYAAGAAAAK